MTNREKINELGGVLLEPEGSGSDKYFLMVSEKWLDSEYKESDHIADTSEMVEPTKKDLGVDCISRQAVLDIVDSYSESQSNVEDVTQDIISDILVLPSATPQEPILDELRAEIATLQNRSYALTKGAVCRFCKYECEHKAESEGT